MPNKITIKTIPPFFSNKQKSSIDYQVRKMIATQDLDLASKTIARLLQHNISVHFSDEIILSVSINTNTLKTYIDYSEVKSHTAVRLIKLYMNDNMESFAKEWMKLA